MSDTPEDLSKVDLDGPEKPRPEYLAKAYRSRLTTLKRAQEYTRQGDIPRAVEGYNQYLNVLAAYFDVTEDKLNPKLFDPEKDLTELLLISNSYWELAKAYDRSPNLHKESLRCLKQFIDFTLGFKFQYVNAQMVRKFVKSKRAHNLKAFQQAMEKIRIETKGCYIATYCYGENHPITNDLRKWRGHIAPTLLGKLFIETYYFLSPSLVRICEALPIFGVPAKSLIFKPLIRAWTQFIKVFVLK